MEKLNEKMFHLTFASKPRWTKVSGIILIMNGLDKQNRVSPERQSHSLTSRVPIQTLIF